MSGAVSKLLHNLTRGEGDAGLIFHGLHDLEYSFSMRLRKAWDPPISRPAPKGGKNRHATEICKQGLGNFWNSPESFPPLASGHFTCSDFDRVYGLYWSVHGWHTPPLTKLVKHQSKQLVDTAMLSM